MKNEKKKPGSAWHQNCTSPRKQGRTEEEGNGSVAAIRNWVTHTQKKKKTTSAAFSSGGTPRTEVWLVATCSFPPLTKNREKKGPWTRRKSSLQSTFSPPNGEKLDTYKFTREVNHISNKVSFLPTDISLSLTHNDWPPPLRSVPQRCCPSKTTAVARIKRRKKKFAPNTGLTRSGHTKISHRPVNPAPGGVYIFFSLFPTPRLGVASKICRNKNEH